MFVFSQKQFARLTGRVARNPEASHSSALGSMVDLGAGDGATTKIMAKFYDDVSVTELSTTMRDQLAKSGFK